MDIDRFLAKPEEIKVLGETVLIKPLTVKFYPLITQLAYLDQKIISAQKKLKKGEVLDLGSIFTVEEIDQRSELEKEITFTTLKETFGPKLTEEKFDELPMKVIEEVMKGAMKVNGITDEKIEKARKLLLANGQK